MERLPQRFWDKVNKTNTCWLWTASCNQKGYGHFNLDGVFYGAHRLCYEFYKGKIPEGLEIDHLCSARNCVNPELGLHIFESAIHKSPQTVNQVELF